MESLLTAEQVGDRFGLSAEQVRRLARAGDIESVRLGHRSVRFEPESIEEFLRSRRRKANLDRIRAEANGQELADAALDRAARVVGRSRP